MLLIGAQYEVTKNFNVLTEFGLTTAIALSPVNTALTKTCRRRLPVRCAFFVAVERLLMRKALYVLLFALALPVLAQDLVLPCGDGDPSGFPPGELSPPESLRPCCAFGYDPHVRAASHPGVPDW